MEKDREKETKKETEMASNREIEITGKIDRERGIAS